MDEQAKQEIKDQLLAYDRTLLVADPRRCEPKKYVLHLAVLLPVFGCSSHFLMMTDPYLITPTALEDWMHWLLKGLPFARHQQSGQLHA